MYQTWMQLTMSSQLTRLFFSCFFFFAIFRFVQNLKLRRTDCYSSAAICLGRMSESSLREQTSGPTALLHWPSELDQSEQCVWWESTVVFQFISCPDRSYRHCLLSLTSTCLRQTSHPEGLLRLLWFYPHVYLQLNIISTFMAFIVLLRVHVLAQCRSLLKIYKIHGSLERVGTTQKVFKASAGEIKDKHAAFLFFCLFFSFSVHLFFCSSSSWLFLPLIV